MFCFSTRIPHRVRVFGVARRLPKIVKSGPCSFSSLYHSVPKAVLHSKQIMGYRHSVSVAAAVYNPSEDSFLVIKRADNGKVQLPGGVLEENETIEQGVAREVLEETSVVVRPIRLSGVYKNMTAGVVSLVFLCEFTSGIPTPSEEATSVYWIKRGAIPNAMPPAFACRLLDAIDSGAPAIRAHDGTNLL